MQDNCLFCSILKGDIPSYKVYEDEFTYAFLDIHPINRGHTLVIPKTHCENIYSASEKIFTDVMRTVHLLAPKVKQAIGASGINVGINNDRAAGQIIFHLHAHIIPRWEDDGHSNWHGSPYQEGEIGSMQEVIAQEFK